jgi:DNA-binding transcriptional ArsR family regulator
MIIYFIRETDSNFVKIGITNNVKERLSKLQTGNPKTLYISKTYEGNIYGETILHDYFKDYHFNLEWFKFDKKLDILPDELIKDLNSDYITTSTNDIKKVFNDLIEKEEPIYLKKLIELSNKSKSTIIRFLTFNKKEYYNKMRNHNFKYFKTENGHGAESTKKVREVLTEMQKELGYVTQIEGSKRSHLQLREFSKIFKRIKDEFNVKVIHTNIKSSEKINNLIKIERVYNKLKAKYELPIMIKDIAFNTGIERNTISKHLKELNLKTTRRYDNMILKL